MDSEAREIVCRMAINWIAACILVESQIARRLRQGRENTGVVTSQINAYTTGRFWCSRRNVAIKGTNLRNTLQKTKERDVA
jgi:hypothetical protein